MDLQVPPRQKKTLIPRRTIHRDPHEKTDDDKVFPIYFLVLLPNIVGTIVKAYRHNDYSLAFLYVSVFLGFVLLKCCLSRYLSLPENEKSSRKFWLKLTMWFLYTAMSFGVVHHFTYFFPLQSMVALYTVATLCSSFLLYAFIIHDLVMDWKNRSYGEDEIEPLDNQTLDAVKLNQPNSVCEKV